MFMKKCSLGSNVYIHWWSFSGMVMYINQGLALGTLRKVTFSGKFIMNHVPLCCDYIMSKVTFHIYIYREVGKLQKEVVIIQGSLEQKQLEKHNLLLDCKVQDIDISLMLGSLEDIIEVEVSSQYHNICSYADLTDVFNCLCYKFFNSF